jgi:four helix bundle protein
LLGLAQDSGSGTRLEFGWPYDLQFQGLRESCARTAIPAWVVHGRKGEMAADIRSFRDLDAWKISMDLAVLVYELAKRLPATERYELSAQIRRAAVSIPSNVAEGQATGRLGRFLYHTRIALGSLGELETDLELAKRLGMLPAQDLVNAVDQLARTGQLLHGLERSLKFRLLTHAAKCLALLGFVPFAWLAFSALR